jgi:hypothetical protein
MATGNSTGGIGGEISRDELIDQKNPIWRRRFVCSWRKNY